MKKTFLFLSSILLSLFLLSGCGIVHDNIFLKERITANPSQEYDLDDFYFKLVWGTYGESSYDSRTGKLIKTTNATRPEDYVANCILSEEELSEIYELLIALKVEEYPDNYDPNPTLKSDPSITITLTVHTNEYEKTITAEDIALNYTASNKKGQRFLDTVKAISNILKATEEWQSLPDYEFYYD